MSVGLFQPAGCSSLERVPLVCNGRDHASTVRGRGGPVERVLGIAVGSDEKAGASTLMLNASGPVPPGTYRVSCTAQILEPSLDIPPTAAFTSTVEVPSLPAPTRRGRG